MAEMKTDREVLTEDYGIAIPDHVTDEQIERAMDNLYARAASMGTGVGPALRGLRQLQSSGISAVDAAKALKAATSRRTP